MISVCQNYHVCDMILPWLLTICFCINFFFSKLEIIIDGTHFTPGLISWFFLINNGFSIYIFRCVQLQYEWDELVTHIIAGYSHVFQMLLQNF